MPLSRKPGRWTRALLRALLPDERSRAQWRLSLVAHFNGTVAITGDDTQRHHTGANGFSMPARTRSTWSGHQSGGWHAAAHELAVLVVVELEYCRQQFFIRSRHTSPPQNIYHDWTVAMGWGGAESPKGWYVDNDDKVARINKRSQSFRQRVRRFAASYGFGRELEGSCFAEDLYYAAVATLVDDGVVTKWVRRRDIRGRSKAQVEQI